MSGLLRPFLWGAVPLSTLLLAVMPVLPTRAMVLVIVAWLVLIVLRAFVDPVPITRAQLRWCGFLALPFLLMLLDNLRAPDLAEGWKHTERSAALLLFPVGFLLLGAPSTAPFRRAMTDVFSAAAMALALYANIGITISGIPASTGGGFAYDCRAAFTAITSLHPPYAAYFLLCAALFQLDRVLCGATYRAWRIAAILLLFTSSALLASRMPLVAFLVAALCIVALRLHRGRALVLAGTILLGGVLTALALPGARQRIMESFDATAIPATQAEVNSCNIRRAIAHCTHEAIGAHWLVGTGQARAQATLDTCYQQFGIPILLDGSYGTHNQPLHWWLCFGIAGLLLFVLYFSVLLRSAWHVRDHAHFAFLVLLLLCMLTENLLARQWGVVLFASFNALFVAGRLETNTRPGST